ncbi:MAG TPA: hypothetical protein VHB77_01325, partial [Planctomycetaceae bacterium]|nr:hypothetical protein [Planctomycetaceae bacterium]
MTVPWGGLEVAQVPTPLHINGSGVSIRALYNRGSIMKSFVFQRWVRQAFGVRGRQHAVVSRRRLGLESLEDRRLLAGDITASLAAGSLTLVGGSADDSLVITQSSTGDLVVTGLNGTTINGKTEYTAKVLHNLTIRTNDGNDSITIQGAAIPGDLTINTGNGDDTVVLAGQTVTPDPAAEQTEEEEVIPTSVGRNLSIVMGSGQDSLNLGGAEEEEEGGGGGNGGGG